MPMRAVIFDFDGVLVDSEPLHYRALRDSLLPEGITITPEEYARTYLAYTDHECIRIALETHHGTAPADRVQEIAQRKAEIFESSIGDIAFFEGARELVLQLSRSVPVAIASGALRGEIEHILEVAKLRPAFVTVVGADDVRQGKPHPEPYLTALARIRETVPDLHAAECLVVEDSMAGIAAGLAAGMRVLGVAHSFAPEKLGAAHRVVPSLRALDASSLQELFPR
jgi:HAD superfamily hydrolase (TIGR01509 family)